jgi:Macrocin-O-methyltransferase (TylF)
MNDLEGGARARYMPSGLARLIHSLRAGVASALNASRDVSRAPTAERVVEHVDYERVEQIVRSVAEEMWARRSELNVVLQEIALRDSAQFVIDQIPLHLGKTHYELRRDAVLAAPDGLFMEFGVWKGAWLSQMAAIRDVPFYGFDSFEGLPEPWAFHEAGQFDLGGDLPEMPQNVTLVKGWFADSLPAFLEQHPQPVAFLHVDCDLYTSTKTVLDLLTPRLVPGSQLVLDDFMFTPGWQREEHRAFFDYIAEHNWQFEYTGYSSDFPACSASVQLVAQG